MVERSRQPRHSLAVTRTLVRVVLLWAIASIGVGCPAVLDLESEQEQGREPEQGPSDAARSAMASSADDAPQGWGGAASPREQVRSPSEADRATHCGEPPAPGGPRDASALPDGALGVTRPAVFAGGAGGTELALQAVRAAGYVLPCGSEQTHVLQVPGGYELSALGHTGSCPPRATMYYRLFISNSGQITVRGGVEVDPAQLRCDGGVPSLVAEGTEPPLA